VTTVVYANGVMIGDTAVFDRGTYVGETQKVFQREDGAMIGICGRLGEMLRFKAWFLAGESGDRPAFDEDDSEAMVVRPDGSIWWYGKDDHTEITAPYAAIGSGFRIALGAFAAGADAEKAARICCDLDSHTRAPVIALFLPRLDTTVQIRQS